MSTREKGLGVRPFGSTGADVSVLGLGCGGPSRLGTRGTVNAETTGNAAAIVREAIQSGITLIDTAESYGTQPAVADVIGACRDDVILCTKKAATEWGEDGSTRFVPPAEFEVGINACLAELRVEAVDVFFLHGIAPDEYAYTTGELLPVLERARDAGKCRWIGVTEMFQKDTRHDMLTRALGDGWPEVVMVGFSPLNQSARETILPRTREMGVATLGMFAVRRALSNPDRLREIVGELIEAGELGSGDIDRAEPFGFVGDFAAVLDAAYRYSAFEPGLDCTLFGTGNAEHLRANVASAARGPLPNELRDRISSVFHGIDSITGH